MRELSTKNARKNRALIFNIFYCSCKKNYQKIFFYIDISARIISRRVSPAAAALASSAAASALFIATLILMWRGSPGTTALRPAPAGLLCPLALELPLGAPAPGRAPPLLPFGPATLRLTCGTFAARASSRPSARACAYGSLGCGFAGKSSIKTTQARRAEIFKQKSTALRRARGAFFIFFFFTSLLFL